MDFEGDGDNTGDFDQAYYDYCGDGCRRSTTTPTEEEDKIDASELEGKAECTYNRLNVGSSTFKNIIKKFDGDFPVSHLKFTINNLLPSGNYGVTKAPENYWIEIEMSNTQLGKISDLGSATAFVHEIIHAEIYRKMLAAAQMGNLDSRNMTSQQQVDYVNSLRNNFPGIYDYYIDRYKPTWNHNMMAQHYTDIIADAIQQFDNFSHDRQIYEDIAWAGLRKLEDGTTSTAWNNLSDLEKNRILKNLSNYFFNGPSNCN